MREEIEGKGEGGDCGDLRRFGVERERREEGEFIVGERKGVGL